MSFPTKLILFALPLLILIVGVIFIALYSGEALPPRAAYAAQASSPGALYMTSHRRYDFLYKFFGFEYVQPEVLFLGASRVLTFRTGFLNRNPAVGYNASLPGHGMEDVEAFIDLFTPENAPKIVLLQVDQFWFNPDWPTTSEEPLAKSTDVDPERIVTDTRHVIREMLRGGVTIEQLLRRSHPAFNRLALGINAIRNGDGFALDGGIQNVPKPYDQAEQMVKLGLAISHLHQGSGHYLHGAEVNEVALDNLERMLDKAAALNIEVIGFAPGFMPTLYAEMIRAGNHTYIAKSMTRVQAIFEERGFYFFDFTDLSALGTDAEMMDGNHSTELLSLKMYMKMLETAPELLGPYSDLEGLQAMLDNAPNPGEVIPREYGIASVP